MFKKIDKKRQTISYVKYGSTSVIYFYDNFIKTQLLVIKAQFFTTKYYILRNIFLTTYLKHFVFIESFDLNSRLNNLIESFSIKDCLVNFLFESKMNSCILPISSKISRFSLCGLTLIMLNPVSSFIIFLLFSSPALSLSVCPFSSISIPNLGTGKRRSIKYLLTLYCSFIISFGNIFFIFSSVEYSLL